MIKLKNIKRILFWTLLSTLCTYNPITHINIFASTKLDNSDSDHENSDHNVIPDSLSIPMMNSDEYNQPTITIDEVKAIARKLQPFANEVINDAQNDDLPLKKRLRTYIAKKTCVMKYRTNNTNYTYSKDLVLSTAQIEQCGEEDCSIALPNQEGSRLITLFGALKLISNMNLDSLDDSEDKDKTALTNRTLIMGTNYFLLGFLANIEEEFAPKNVQECLKEMFSPYADIVVIGKIALSERRAKELDRNKSIWNVDCVVSDPEPIAFFTGFLISAAGAEGLLAQTTPDNPKDKDQDTPESLSNGYYVIITSGILAIGGIIGYAIGNKNANQKPKKKNIPSLLDEDYE